MKFWQARLETRHFSFEAYGTTDEEARNALIAALRKHGGQRQIALDWWEDFADSINYREIELGRAYRDRELL
jgi:hypothetical protein